MAHALQDRNTEKLGDILVQDCNKIDEQDNSYETTSLKIGNIKVHVRSSFYPDKSLYDAMFMIASTKLKETPV